MLRASLIAVVALLLPGFPARAQSSTVIYRCTDAAGVVTLQNGTPCPKGSAQVKRVIEATQAANPQAFPQALPAPPPMQTVPTPVGPTQVPAGSPAQGTLSSAASTPASTIPAPLPLPAATAPPAQRLPPPPLYQCNTVENDSYLSDSAEPKPRCIRQNTVGIDGSQRLGAGQACAMVYDQCQRIPDNAACPAWHKRVNEAQAAWTFARADMAAELKTEYERIARVVAETTCNL